MKIYLITLFALSEMLLFPNIIAAQTANQLPRVPNDKYVLVDGHKMYYLVEGKGPVAVIFESGHDDDHSAWTEIFSSISKLTRVVSYDRLGMGKSQPSDKARTYSQIAIELYEMLKQARIPPPYILVGHSMGGAVIRAFANLYQDETKGLVMLDPFNEFESNAIPKKALEYEVMMMDSMMKRKPSTVQAEFNFLRSELLNGFPQLSSYSFTDIPTVLMIAGSDRPPGWVKNGCDLFQQKVIGLSDARLIVLPQSPHYIQNYDPTSVIENIKRVLYPNATVILKKTYKEKGADSTVALYKKMKRNYPQGLLTEAILNSLGYAALTSNDLGGAIHLFALNVSLYPASANAYDSLGEAFMVSGKKKEAIKNYEKSLALNPANTNAEEMLKKLR
jgi:pimeloyl-ACP methyl ester carboxylesterase